MKKVTKTAKVNRWLHEHLAMKTPAKLLGGLALGALLAVAIALPFRTTYTDEPARPLSSERIQCYPEDNVVCLYDAISPEILADLARMYAGLDEMVPSDPALTTGTSISGVQFEEWPEAGFDSYTYHRFMVEQGKVGRALTGEDTEVFAPGDDLSYLLKKSVVDRVLSNREIERMDYEIDSALFDAARNLVAGNRLSSEQLELIYDLEIMGIPWRIDEEGMVVVVETPQESVAATAIYRYDRRLDDEFMSDAPFFHTLNQGKAGSPLVSKQTECYPELDIC